MTIPALIKAREELENFVGSWNGDTDTFIFEDGIYHESDIDCAQDAIKKIDELQLLLVEINI